jgi:WD40 repeat protein
MANFIGRTIQHYQVLLKIRETPTRTLYRAYDKRAHAYVALEIVKNARFDPLELLTLINARAQQNAGLSHANIAVMTDSGIHHGTIYLVYDFQPSHPLRRFFNRTYPWEEMARELAPIAHAIMYAHDSGVVHGFLNPASILLDEKKNPILFDFGFEQLITDYVLTHSPGTWLNRWGLEYRAPEHVNGCVPDKLCDIYSFGMIINEWLTGTVPVQQTTQSHGRGKSKPSRKKKSEKQLLPGPIQNFVGRCTAPNPSRRYQSMQEVFAILANGALNMSITNQLVKKPLSRSTHRFSPGWTALILTLGFLLIGAGAVFINMSGLLSSANTPTRPPTVLPTRTPKPVREETTATVLPSTSAPTTEFNPFETEFQSSIAFQGTPMASPTNPIKPTTAGRIGLVGQWGMGDLTDLMASPDGQKIAAATSMGVFIFDLDNLELEQYLDTGSWISAVAFSPDGKLLASGEQDGLIEIWDTSNWQEAQVPLSGHTQPIVDLAFSPDGTKLASIGKDHQLMEWSLQDPSPPQVADLPLTGVNAVAYTADNRQILTGGNDFKVQVWDTGNLSQSQPATLNAKIIDMASSRETGMFVIGSSDQRVMLFDLANGMTRQPLGSLDYPLTSVAASPDGNLFAAGDVNGGIRVWESNGNELWKTQNYIVADLASLTLPGRPHTLSFSPDGKFLYAGLHDGLIRKLDAHTGQELQKNQSLDGHVEKLTISDDSKYVITQNNNQTITLWDLPDGRPLDYINGSIKDGFPFSPDSKYLAVAPDFSRVKVYELPDLQEVYTFNDHRNIKTIEFIKGNEQLSAGNNKEMHLWSLSSGQELKIRPNFPGTGCNTFTDLNGLQIFRITDYQYIVPVEQLNPSICAFQTLDWATDIEKDANFIAYGGNSKLAVIDLRSRLSPVSEMNVNLKNVVRVAIAPGGEVLAAAYDDNVIHLWDVAAKQEITSLYGHTGPITDLVFTADGKYLFSTSTDGTIRIWGVPN